MWDSATTTTPLTPPPGKGWSERSKTWAWAKAAARYVTGSNTEAGVAMAVERYFLDT